MEGKILQSKLRIIMYIDTYVNMYVTWIYVRLEVHNALAQWDGHSFRCTWSLKYKLVNTYVWYTVLKALQIFMSYFNLVIFVSSGWLWWIYNTDHGVMKMCHEMWLCGRVDVFLTTWN